MDESEQNENNTNLKAPTASRKEFITTVVICLIIIILLPLGVNLMLRAMNTGYAAVNMMIRAIVLPFALLILCIPLIKITRRRLHDLTWPTRFVFVFPILPLFCLADGPIRAITMLGMGGTPLFQNDKFWIGIVLAVCLAIIPRWDELKSDNRLFNFLYGLFTTRGAGISQSQYRRIFLLILSLSIIFSLAISTFAMPIIPIFGSEKINMTSYYIIQSLSLIISIIFTLIILVATYQRMKEVSPRPYVGIIPAVLFTGVPSTIIMMPKLIVLLSGFLRNPMMFIGIFINIAVLIFFIWLFFAKDMEKKAAL